MSVKKKRVKTRVNKLMKPEPQSISIAEAVLRASRPNFLLLTIAIIILSFSIAHHLGAELSPLKSVLIILSALFAHLAVNWLNEYQDFQSGLDSMTSKTPFSGGSGALINQPKGVKAVKFAVYASLLIVVISGLMLVWLSDVLLLIFGLVGVLLIVSYTKYITRFPWLCLIAPGLAFGPIMVLGIIYSLTMELNLLAVLLSLIPFFLVSNLLLLNQIPDLEADRKVGRYNVLMVLGLEDGIQLFAAFTWLAFIILGIAYWGFNLPSYTALGFATLLVVFPMLRQLQLHYVNVDKLVPVLTMNVIITVFTPMLIGVGFIIS